MATLREALHVSSRICYNSPLLQSSITSSLSRLLLPAGRRSIRLKSATANGIDQKHDLLFGSSLVKSRKLRAKRVPKQKCHCVFSSTEAARAGAAAAAAAAAAGAEEEEVRAVLFDMDGVLCDSEERSREAAVALFAEWGLSVTTHDFVPFMGTGEANFLGGVARLYGVADFDPVRAKQRFFEIYISKYAQPNSGLGYSGALDLILQCKAAGLKTAVASSADRVKVDANLAAAGLPQANFDAIMSADKFENLKPAPDIFLAASASLGIPPSQCVVIEDALAGVQAARAAGMRCIAVTTTLTEDGLRAAGPGLVRGDISRISLADILGLKYSQAALQATTGARGGAAEEPESAGQAYAETESSSANWLEAPLTLPTGQVVTRRNVLRGSSLAVGLASTWFTLTHLKGVKQNLRRWGVPWIVQAAVVAYVVRRWSYLSKALSYASPQALINAAMGVGNPFATVPGQALAGGGRVAQLKQFIADLEKRGGGMKVADFKQGLPWLNSPPLSLARELKGKLVVLDFWTYCCINCMHVLPDLAFLENKYKGQPVAVVGVHSAKFDNEKDSTAIRNAVLRYDVTHPVVNDGEMTMWRAVGVSSWPTLAVVSPSGRLIGMLAGEGHREDLDDILQAGLEYYGEKGQLDRTPVPEALERSKDSRLLASPLAYPGKIATDLANGRLFISDSNNHRIVVTDVQGKFITQVGGGGGEGLRDGSFEQAAFNRPQGVAYNAASNVLYVADTENHALREVDLVNESVRTLAGNGTKGQDYSGGGVGSSQVLNSPWDVEYDPAGRRVYVAMAGQHQIWSHDLATGATRSFSGNGYERNQNGKTGGDTSYAQPSGLSLTPDGQEMLIADSESSSVRAVSLTTGGSRLLAGGDPLFAENLFQFGDKDGVGSSAQLQHPLGVLCASDGKVYIADSYNHRIKSLDPVSKEVKTVAGSGKAGFRDASSLSAQVSEPAGLAQGPDGKIFIADTNNSVIRVLDPSAGYSLSTLDLSQIPPPPKLAPTATRKRLRRRQTEEADVVKVAPVAASSGALEVRIDIPEGYHYTKGAVSRYEADADPDESVSVDPPSGQLALDGLSSTASLRFSRPAGAAGDAVLRVSCKVYYCQQDEVCLYKAVVFEIPFAAAAEEAGTPRIPLAYTVVPKVVNTAAFATR